MMNDAICARVTGASGQYSKGVGRASPGHARLVEAFPLPANRPGLHRRTGPAGRLRA